MKKQEFKELFNKKDDISTKKVSNILIKYSNETDNKDTKHCMDLLDNLSCIEDFVDSVAKYYNLKEPYPIQNAYDLLRMRIVHNYIDSLED